MAPATHVTAAVARVGFDHGWLCLPPTFLNLQLPVLVVDQRLLPDPSLLGLEPFGSRDPRLPLPTTRIVVQHHPGAMISIWDHHPCDPSAQLLGWHHAHTHSGHPARRLGTDRRHILGGGGGDHRRHPPHAAVLGRDLGQPHRPRPTHQRLRMSRAPCRDRRSPRRRACHGRRDRGRRTGWSVAGCGHGRHR